MEFTLPVIQYLGFPKNAGGVTSPEYSVNGAGTANSIRKSGRAIGETMIVVMAAGLSANLTANPLEAVTTVTVQIVTLQVGEELAPGALAKHDALL